MPRDIHNDVLDAGLALVKAAATRQVGLTARPTSYAQVAGLTLASVAVDDGTFTLGDHTGLHGGRQLSVPQLLSDLATAGGQMTHLALVDDVGQRVLYTTTTANTTIVVNERCTFQTWRLVFGDPLSV